MVSATYLCLQTWHTSSYVTPVLRQDLFPPALHIRQAMIRHFFSLKRSDFWSILLRVTPHCSTTLILSPVSLNSIISSSLVAGNPRLYKVTCQLESVAFPSYTYVSAVTLVFLVQKCLCWTTLFCIRFHILFVFPVPFSNRLYSLGLYNGFQPFASICIRRLQACIAHHTTSVRNFWS